MLPEQILKKKLNQIDQNISKWTTKTSDEQKMELFRRFDLGEKRADLAKAFGISYGYVCLLIKKRKEGKFKPTVSDPDGIKNLDPESPGHIFLQFTKRARSVLWRLDASEKGVYKKWEESIERFVKDGLERKQAIVMASKDFPCLYKLFREYNVKDFDPKPDSHPDILHAGEPVRLREIQCDDKEMSHSANLRWAIEAAGKYIRTREAPDRCPNNSAFYLWKQACEEPSKFLDKLTAVEMKRTDDIEARAEIKVGNKLIKEIEEMLNTLDNELAD